jgi:hypothetical protein
VIVEQRIWSPSTGWKVGRTHDDFARAQLVLVFGSSARMEQPGALAELKACYPGARIVGCSTAGEICDTNVVEDRIVATAIHFAQTEVQVEHLPLIDATHSAAVGRELARRLLRPGLQHVFVLAEGLAVNGSELVAGMTDSLPAGVAITGGLAGDGERFARTAVCVDGVVSPRVVAAIGFSGSALRVGYGSMGGWDVFGPERLVTRAQGNRVFELDGEPALDLYKRYLGPHAADLPSSGLLFPLSLRGQDGGLGVVRTILAIDEQQRSLTFAGDVPQGSYARLMKANVDRLIDGATSAAGASYQVVGSAAPELAILISCVGRRLVLGQRVDEEVESVRDVLGAGAVLAGFYSYGEIAPFMPNARCELHNQTMTITTLSER